MSYSRFSNSRWYTFWHWSEDETKNNQMFSVCHVLCFSYADLKNDIEKCLDKAIEIENGKSEIPVSIGERQELKTYMMRFIEDAEEDYK
jgi:hypothetical protein